MPLKFNTWTKFYRDNKQEEGILRDMFDSGMSLFNETTMSHLNNNNALKLTVASSVFNFVILPRSEKSINLVHNLMLVPRGIGLEPVVVWHTQGNRSTLPFQVIPNLITTASWSRRGKANRKWTVPSLEKFLEMHSKEQFDKLEAEAGVKIDKNLDFTTIPSHLFVHPLLFFEMEGKGNLSAKSAVARLVDRLQSLQSSASSEEAEGIGAFIASTHLALGFIWAVNKGIIVPILLEYPPEADSVD